MIKVTLPDGAIKEIPKGSTPMDIALSISEGLARNVISAKVNDTTVEVTT
ncbi:MAG TPA: TGS domain-containing protein, partial [Vicingus sp.]|nr:TGS domain-containing protein [Vicingus sp.]